MNKKLLAILFLITISIVVQAHEFWIQPQKYFYAIGEKATLSFKVGQNFTGEPWNLKHHRIERLELLRGSQTIDLKTNVKEGDKDNLEIELKENGTHLIVMQSNNAFIELEADKFNSYLKEDGLDNVYDIRKNTNTLNKPSKEFYSRHTKLLFQVGDVKDDTYKKVMGLPIEIVPDRNPYSLKKGDLIRFKILWQGKPVFGARIKVWNRFDNRTTIQNIYTEQDGTMETHISNPGAWMVSVVRMIPSTKEGADWESYWGSLVFGVKF
ncbi:MAG TPA: DUF4198 domain-containing protein [Chryseolinea sp.]|nr:DUF4198 domain-containing protein [Chryseolinea sp.]